MPSPAEVTLKRKRAKLVGLTTTAAGGVSYLDWLLVLLLFLLGLAAAGLLQRSWRSSQTQVKRQALGIGACGIPAAAAGVLLALFRTLLQPLLVLALDLDYGGCCC